MAFIPTAGTVRIDALIDLFGQHCENTFWFFNDGADPTPADLLAIAGDFNDKFSTTMVNHMSPDAAYRGCVVTSQIAVDSPAIEAALFPVGGTAGLVGMPGNVSFSVKFSTAGRGRSSRGRNYVVGVPTEVVTQDQVSTDWANLVITDYETFLPGLISGGWIWVVVSHFTAHAPRVAGLVEPITTVSYADLTVDSQRRRLRGRGN